MVTGYRVPLPLGYAGGGHGGSCVFNRIMYVGGLFTDSAWAIAARVAIYAAPSFAPAVAHVGPGRGGVGGAGGGGAIGGPKGDPIGGLIGGLTGGLISRHPGC